MVMRKKTLRRLSPVARKGARLAGEVDSIGRRLKNIVGEIQSLELDSAALKHAKDQLVSIGLQDRFLDQDSTPPFPEDNADG